MDEPIDMSDELMEVSENECDKMRVDEMVSNFIAQNRPKDCAEKDTQDRVQKGNRRSFVED